MPKLKTHKGLKKRVRVTRHGKVLCHHPGGAHLQSTKSAKRRRRLRRVTALSGSNVLRVRKSRPA